MKFLFRLFLAVFIITELSHEVKMVDINITLPSKLRDQQSPSTGSPHFFSFKLHPFYGGISQVSNNVPLILKC